MKKLVIVLIVLMFLQAGKSFAQTMFDSTSYFVSWISLGYQSNAAVGISASNDVIKVPSIWTMEKIYAKIKKLDVYLLYIINVKKVSEETYKQYVSKDSSVNVVKSIPPEKEKKWNIEYIVLKNNDLMSAQGTLELTTPSNDPSIRAMEQYIKTAIYTETDKIVVVRFDKK